MLFTQQHKNNISDAHIKYIESNYNWDLVELYWDIRLDNGSRNRKQKFITFREFKEIKVDAGKTIKELSREGYSRMVLGFCSRFCQGMIKLTKEELEEEYKVNDLDYISKKYKIDRGDLACLRQLYNINSTSGMYFERMKREKSLSQRQIEILYGTMLGDACGISGRRISFKHGDCQREYIFWKFDEFKEHCNPSALKANRSVSEKYNLDNVYWQFRTKFNSEFEKCINQFYNGGKKEVSEKITKYLTDLSLAVWFMDDGCVDYQHSKRVRTGYDITPIRYFCTDSFSVESCQNLINWLKNKFNINSRLRKSKKLKDGIIPYNIVIDKSSNEDFLDLIRPYIIPSMLYKIDYKEYKKCKESIK